MQDKAKILFIVDHLQGGGAEIMTLNLAQKLQERGYDISLLLLENKNNFDHITESFKTFSLNVPADFSRGKLLVNKTLDKNTQSRLSDIINNLKPDYIIVTIWYAFNLLPYLKEYKVKVWAQADLLPPFNKTYNPLKTLRNYYKNNIFKRNFIRLMANQEIITLNKDLEYKYLSLLNNSSVHIVRNGIPSPDDNSSLPKEWDVCFVGRLSPSKQVEHALIAFSQSSLIGKMVIVGDGARKEKLKKIAIKLKIIDRIDFIGWSSDTSYYIRKSKLLLLPSLTEGYPLVIGESLMNNTPVLAYNCSEGVASQFYTEDMKRGLVHLNDIHALKLAINNLIKEPYHIPEDIYLRYSLDTMADHFIKLLN